MGEVIALDALWFFFFASIGVLAFIVWLLCTEEPHVDR